MKNVKLEIRKLSKAGFSLVEMLVVIAVIGIIAAIAIPNIGNVNASARKSTAQRNAQTIASTYSAALAAGVTTTALGADETAIYSNLSSGQSTTVGPFANRLFVVPNLPTGTTEKSEILGYLTMNSDSTLGYKAGL